MTDQTRPQIARDLTTMLQTLRDHTGLIRALTDSTGTPESKAELVERVFAALDPSARRHLKEAITKSWRSIDDFLADLELAAVRATWLWAEAEHVLERCMDEVFNFGRLVGHNHELRAAVTDRRASPASRQELVRSLLSGTMTPPAVMLATAAIVSPAGTIDQVVRGFLEIGAELIGARLSLVTVARALPAQQRQRLQVELEAHFGAKIVMQEIVDPQVMGGVRVECGADIIDATIASGLEAARQDFAENRR